MHRVRTVAIYSNILLLFYVVCRVHFLVVCFTFNRILIPKRNYGSNEVDHCRFDTRCMRVLVCECVTRKKINKNKWSNGVPCVSESKFNYKKHTNFFNYISNSNVKTNTYANIVHCVFVPDAKITLEERDKHFSWILFFHSF